MLEKLFKNKFRIFYVSLLILALILVRMFEDALFYDPFLKYYRLDTNLPFPEYNGIGLFFGLLFRYGLNTGISLGIIYTIFDDLELTKFAGFLYAVIFIVLIVSFFIILQGYGQKLRLELFYLRRFLIQPIFLLLFLPAFYFQIAVSKK